MGGEKVRETTAENSMLQCSQYKVRSRTTRTYRDVRKVVVVWVFFFFFKSGFTTRHTLKN